MSKPSPLDHLTNDPQAAELLKNKAGLESLLKSPDTKKLMELLNRNAGGGLKNAAQAAMQGNTGALQSLMSDLLKDPEGAQTVSRIQKSMKK